MAKTGQLKTVTVAAFATLVWTASEADAAQCGSTAAGFETWKNQFAAEARGKGVGASAVAGLMATTYSTETIAADRGQRSFHLSLDQFIAKRGGSAIVARGRALKQSEAHSSRPSSSATASRPGRSWPFGAWRRDLGGSTETKTSSRTWQLSPMTVVGRPISLISSTRR